MNLAVSGWFRQSGRQPGHVPGLSSTSSAYWSHGRKKAYRSRGSIRTKSVPQAGLYREIFNTDEIKYGGKGVHNPLLCADDIPYHGLPNSVKVKVAPLSAIVLEPTTGKEMQFSAPLPSNFEEILRILRER